MRPIVFVAGAWLGGWSWLPVAQRLAAQGAQVLTPTLPGLSVGDNVAGLRLDDAVDALVDEIARRDLRDVVLVCHSWGGYPATGAAHRSSGRVSKVVYYNAVVPSIGMSMADENDTYGRLIRQAVAAHPDLGVPIAFDSVRNGLRQDEPGEVQRLVYEMLVPQPGGYMVDPSDVEPVTAAGLEAEYVLGEHDISLARPGAEFAARLGVDPVMVPGSHMAMLTRPDDVAPALVKACQ